MSPLVLIAFGVLAFGILIVRSGRGRALAQIRANWGQPVTRERKMDAMAASHQSRLSNIEGTASLDDRTWDDLHLDAVFATVDRTESTLGQHALYHRLRTAPVADNLESFDLLVNRFQTEAPLRERAQIALSRLRDPNGYDLWWLVRPDAIHARPWYVIFPILTTATLAWLILAVLFPKLVPILIPVFVVNVIVRYLTDRQIRTVATAFRQIAPVVRTAKALRFLDHADVRPIVGPIQAQTPTLGRLKTIAQWISGDPLMLPSGAGMLALFINDTVSVVYEYLNLVFLLDGNGVYFGARELRADGAALVSVMGAVGDVDAAVSVASFRSGRPDWTRPRFLQPGAPAEFVYVCHPLLVDPAPNSITVAPGSGVLITGSNMSGKSTFLRTVGVTAVMAQTLNTCLAKEYCAPAFNVRSCIGRADDLLTGKSYFMVEVESLLGLVRASADAVPNLFLLDELFRGTNAVERIAAGQAVLLELVSTSSRPNLHVVFAATHDGELADLLPGKYSTFHFGDKLGADGLTFDHRLQPGPATSRNAIALLRLNGASENLIRRATETAAALDAQRRSSTILPAAVRAVRE